MGILNRGQPGKGKKLTSANLKVFEKMTFFKIFEKIAKMLHFKHLKLSLSVPEAFADYFIQ